jgi:hypothetical protein
MTKIFFTGVSGISIVKQLQKPPDPLPVDKQEQMF